MSTTPLRKPEATVAICTPCQDQVSASFALDLAKLVGFTSRHHREIELSVVQVKGSILPAQRSTLVSQALQMEASHVLWLDSDMRFPKDALVRLLALKQPIVAANYPTRRPPILPVADDKQSGGLLFTLPDSPPNLVPVMHVGMGVMLVETAVYRKMEAPWFALGYSKADQSYVGEDVFFCRKAREAGYQILVDQALSQDVKHVGELEWTHAYANQTRLALAEA